MLKTKVYIWFMRFDHNLVNTLISPDERVLDLGCGDGSLMRLLRAKGALVQGIEIESELVEACIASGLGVLQEDLDEGIQGYKDQSFDKVILNKTLQATHKPLLVLKEAARVGKEVLVSFSNFGHWLNPFQLAMLGHMPKNADLPYEWYDTPNIHLVTIADFDAFCHKNDFQVKERFFYSKRRFLPSFGANLLAPYALFRLSQLSSGSEC